MKKRVKPEFNVLAGLLVLSGIALLLEGNGVLLGIHNLWPIFVFVIGLGLSLMFYQGRKDIGLIGLGSFMIMLSIFFFYLNFTSWALLKNLWPVFISIVAVSILLCFLYNKKKIFLVVGLFGVLLSITFILIFGVAESLWPVSLIIAGLLIYIISFFDRK
jgi:presenilin-like A22 family membrane protease